MNTFYYATIKQQGDDYLECLHVACLIAGQYLGKEAPDKKDAPL
jgi:hypothetical protein